MSFPLPRALPLGLVVLSLASGCDSVLGAGDDASGPARQTVFSCDHLLGADPAPVTDGDAVVFLPQEVPIVARGASVWLAAEVPEEEAEVEAVGVDGVVVSSATEGEACWRVTTGGARLHTLAYVSVRADGDGAVALEEDGERIALRHVIVGEPASIAIEVLGDAEDDGPCIAGRACVLQAVVRDVEGRPLYAANDVEWVYPDVDGFVSSAGDQLLLRADAPGSITLEAYALDLATTLTLELPAE